MAEIFNPELSDEDHLSAVKKAFLHHRKIHQFGLRDGTGYYQLSKQQQLKKFQFTTGGKQQVKISLFYNQNLMR